MIRDKIVLNQFKHIANNVPAAAEYVRPACLPPIGWAGKLNGGKMVISGMGKTPQLSAQSPNMKVASIPMKSKVECKNNPSIGPAFKGEFIN